jgi:Tfp pilus assembly protein PilO
MKENFNKTYNNLTRTLSTPEFAYRMYGIWFLVVLVYFGMFQILPLCRSIYNKHSFTKELKDLNSKIQTNIAMVKVGTDSLDKYKDQYKLVTEQFPDNYQTQNFLVDLSFATASFGYKLTKFDPFAPEFMETVGGSPGVTVTVEGAGSLAGLVQNIEKLKYVYQVNKIQYVKQTRGESATIEIFLYEMGEGL